MYSVWTQRQNRRTNPRLSRREHTIVRVLKRTFFHWSTIVMVVGAVFLGTFVYGILTYVSFANDLATPERIMNRNNRGLLLFDKDGALFYRTAEAKDLRPVSIEVIPKHVQDATVAAEDAQFYSHPGFSVAGMVRSTWKNMLARDPFRFGGSTITQQLVKNSLVGVERTYARKIKEFILAVEIERRFTKGQILEMYLNSVYYGSNAFGAAEAAELYFGKKVSDLSLAEAAVLAGIPNAPSYLSPHAGNLDATMRRQQYVLGQMREHNFILQDQEEDARKQTLTFIPPKHDPVASPHFALSVIDEVRRLFPEDEAERRGFRVTTTLDRRVQSIAEEEIANGVKRLTSQKVTNGAMVVQDPKTGSILAMVGSADWENDAIGGKFNAATQALRQPGSSIKPVIYLDAIRRRLVTPTTILQDEPKDFGGYKPKNFDGRFRGEVTVRRALANSLNVPSVQIMEKVGVRHAVELAQALGLSTLTDPNRYGLSLVLGGGEVKLVDMVGAYAAIADGGVWHEPHMVIKIEDKFGTIVYTYERGIRQLFSLSVPPQRSKTVVDAASAYLVTHILSDSGARAEVFGNLLSTSRPMAVKTGTTDDYRDSWTIGYSPQLVVGVWIGNNDNSPMLSVSGSIGAAQVWRAAIERMHQGAPIQTFERPSGIFEVGVCTGTFLRDDASDIREVYLTGTEPTQLCHPPSPIPTPAPTPEPTPEPFGSAQGLRPTPQPEADRPLDETPTPTPTPSPTPSPSPTPLIELPSL
ncbi:MAG: PBP1A family penicillin-binding protein [bacterium]|nr:PBP1A family penicillin-binding protein [bacterium]